MAHISPVTTHGTGNNPFIATVGQGFTEGFASIGRDVLPIWTARQLADQQYAPNRNPTFYAAAARQRADNLLDRLLGPPGQVGFREGTEEVGRTALLIGAVLIAGIILLKV